VPVHLYGHPVDLDGISAVAKRHNLLIVEDAAQAHGARFRGGRIGSFGNAAAFSFYPGKNLGAYGDAGLTTTSDEALAKKMRLLVDHGRTTKYSHDLIGYNYRLDGIQAAVLNVKLRHLDDWNRSRRRLAHRYTEALSGLPVETPAEKRGHVYHLYVIQVDDREGLGKFLGDQGIATGVHYPLPLHQQPALKDLAGSKKRLPVTERVAERILSLPMFPEMTDAQQDRVVEGVRSFLKG